MVCEGDFVKVEMIFLGNKKIFIGYGFCGGKCYRVFERIMKFYVFRFFFIVFSYKD